MPYLNSAPFFQGLSLGSAELVDCVPRQLGERAAAGELCAGLLPLADFLRLRDRFERLGHFGIAVRGRAHSALLFSRRPVRQLDGCAVAITEESSTTACLVRLLLEQHFRLKPSGYPRTRDAGAEALVLIGDEALRQKHAKTGYPYETDLAFEWWLWQHMPFVFAVWAVRKDLPAEEKRTLEVSLIRTLSMNLSRLPQLAQEASGPLGIPEETLHLYLSNFVYRLGPSEEEAMKTFEAMCHEHALL